MAPTCLYVLPTTSGQALNESEDGVLGDLLQNLQQSSTSALGTKGAQMDLVHRKVSQWH